ncbi:hypothetical protein TNCV_2036361 [Trichonephila clavipes]|nr:hypothetical protein TNCV_2036361 [Trichonephila clavipes]
MHLIYRLAEGITHATLRLYRERLPQRDALDRRMFANLHHNLEEYGSFRGQRNREGGRTHQIVKVSNTFCSILGTKCVGYRLKESEDHA